MTFNAKNLTYESKEPIFLRRLRGDCEGDHSTYHDRPGARPRKQMKEGDEDDQPAYVVEDTQDTLSKEEYTALLDGRDAKAGFEVKASSPNTNAQSCSDLGDVKEAPAGLSLKQRDVAIGASKKRRLPKVVGEENMQTSSMEGINSDAKMAKGKKSKRVKLSFDDDEGPAK